MASFTELLDLASERLGGAVHLRQRRLLRREGEPAQAEGGGVHRARVHRPRQMDGRLGVAPQARARTRLLPRAPRRCRGSSAASWSTPRSSAATTPSHCSIEACVRARRRLAGGAALARDEVGGDPARIAARRGLEEPLRGRPRPHRFTHLRFNIFPDGGVARLRVHGDVVPDIRRLGGKGVAHEIDLAAAENGGARALVQRHVLRRPPQPHHARPRA